MNPTRDLARDWAQRLSVPELEDWMYQQLVEGSTAAQVELAMYDFEPFRVRFRGMYELRDNGGAISPGEYLEWENSARQTMAAHGLPPGFYDDPEDFADMIASGKNVVWLNDVLTEYDDVVEVGRDELRGQLVDHLSGQVSPAEAVAFADGVTNGEWAAFMMDPDKSLPLLRSRVRGAKISAAGMQVGFGALSASEADRLAAGGVDEAGARDRLGAIAGARDVTGALAGEDDGLDRQLQLAAARGDQDAVRRLEDRRRQRQGAFEGSSQFATSNEGISGVGTSR